MLLIALRYCQNKVAEAIVMIFNQIINLKVHWTSLSAKNAMVEEFISWNRPITIQRDNKMSRSFFFAIIQSYYENNSFD